jgi:hypothetical protein
LLAPVAASSGAVSFVVMVVPPARRLVAAQRPAVFRTRASPPSLSAATCPPRCVSVISRGCLQWRRLPFLAPLAALKGLSLRDVLCLPPACRLVASDDPSRPAPTLAYCLSGSIFSHRYSSASWDGCLQWRRLPLLAPLAALTGACFFAVRVLPLARRLAAFRRPARPAPTPCLVVSPQQPALLDAQRQLPEVCGRATFAIGSPAAPPARYFRLLLLSAADHDWLGCRARQASSPSRSFQRSSENAVLFGMSASGCLQWRRLPSVAPRGCLRWRL